MSNQNGITGNNVPHLGQAAANERSKIKSLATNENKTPIPDIDQDAQTGPEMVGAEDPRHDSVKKKRTFLERLLHLNKNKK
ncbi:uncharacterized protein MJAP1_002645 [Malassezia japonica]|uniref:Uncharacterized protein n=1 Tax=Malassezia japonica TaxID=223818 RepID=A0AAF0F2N0_9BASI|nr:uncharacterized protein MJAP1_002645 [Malassezia japonica]WFD39665.1 hypothetical protein MJAP1_002645 [Malassezia japonica]